VYVSLLPSPQSIVVDADTVNAAIVCVAAPVVVTVQVARVPPPPRILPLLRRVALKIGMA
jgi:hypothetical protein